MGPAVYSRCSYQEHRRTNDVDISAIALVTLSIAVMVVSLIAVLRRQGNTAARALAETLDHVTRQLQDLQVENAVNRGKINNLEDQVYTSVRMIDTLSDGIWILTEQLLDLNETPRWEPPHHMPVRSRYPNIRSASTPDIRRNLYHLFGEYFNLDELRLLCAGLEGIEFENISGETRQTKAMELVDLMFRHGRLVELVEIGRVQRPKVVWPSDEEIEIYQRR